MDKRDLYVSVNLSGAPALRTRTSLNEGRSRPVVAHDGDRTPDARSGREITEESCVMDERAGNRGGGASSPKSLAQPSRLGTVQSSSTNRPHRILVASRTSRSSRWRM